MGMTRDSNDILNRPPIAINPRIDYRGFSTATISQSATSTLTAISIDGPGVINLFQFEPPSTAQQSVKIRAIVDGVTAVSFSGVLSTAVNAGFQPGGIALVGGFNQTIVATFSQHVPHMDQIPFENNFTVKYQIPNHSLSYGVTIRYAYRLTE